MTEHFALRGFPVETLPIEIVERKGIGHPDTICDALAENLSRNLCRWYIENAGAILHHNVDKALLRGGSANASFGNGQIDEPIDIYLAGRAVTAVGDLRVPVAELAVDGSRAWLKEHLRELDSIKDVRIHCLVREGSADLVGLFERAATNLVPKANDTSIGVGFWPLSPLEQATLQAGAVLDAPVQPARGEDTKIMAVRRDNEVALTVACAMIAKRIPDATTYGDECRAIAADIKGVFDQHRFAQTTVAVNAADDPENDSFYVTVTGTSAEAGDDGQVGRGNRANGLITPHRSMSLEAVCGKNPVNHVGKLYNIAAQQIAQRLVNECHEIEAAQCCLVSQIGRTITEPSTIDIAIATADGSPPSEHHEAVRDTASCVLSEIPAMIDQFISGQIQLY